MLVQALKKRNLDPKFVIDTLKLNHALAKPEVHLLVEVKVGNRYHTINFFEGADAQLHLVMHRGQHKGLVFQGNSITINTQRRHTRDLTPESRPAEILPEFVRITKETMNRKLPWFRARKLPLTVHVHHEPIPLDHRYKRPQPVPSHHPK
ncbi:MAG TPA: hypothetical protein VJH23_05735 [archaeon]|nr:hypothetical protein [archaeon]